MKIGIDIDEVVAEFLCGFLNFYKNKTGIALKKKDFITYNLWEVLKCKKSESIDLMNEFSYSDFFNQLNLVPGAKDSINFLNRGNELFFITARPYKIKKQTDDFFKKHFPENKFEIFYSAEVYMAQDGKNKSKICNDLEINLFIEDNKNYAKNCAENGINVLLFDAPWNQNCKNSKNIIRVYNWIEILEKIKRFKNERI